MGWNFILYSATYYAVTFVFRRWHRYPLFWGFRDMGWYMYIELQINMFMILSHVVGAAVAFLNFIPFPS